MINQRQNGRRRGRGGQRQNGGGRGPEMGNRIDNRARGNAAQLLEKYKTLARDAQQGGDRVLAEYYLQFADHYFRVLAESRARYEEANPQARRERYEAEGDDFDGEGSDGGEGEDGDEFEPRQARPQQQQRAYRDDRPQQQERGERQYRDDRPRRDDRPERQERAPREDRAPRAGLRPRNNGNGNGNGSYDDQGDSGLPFDALPPAINAPSMDPVVGVEGEVITATPRRRGRPRKVAEDAGTSE